MSTTTGQNRNKFGTGKLILICLLIGLIAMIAHFVLKYLYSFKFLDEDTNATIFYSWRTSHADKHMAAAYEPAKKKSWDTKNQELANFINFAEEGKMLNDKGCEHFPRESINYYTHSFEWNDTVFLPVRKFLMEKNKKDNKDELFANEKVVFLNLPNFSLSKHDDPSVVSLAELHAAKDKLLALLTHLSKVDKAGKILNDTKAENNETIKLTYALFKEMKYSHSIWKGGKKEMSPLTETHVLNFYKNLGRASTTVFESFMFSRMSYMFYFYTLSVVPLKDGEKLKDRFMRVAKNFDQVFVKAYKDPNDAKKLSSWAATVKKFYSPKMIDVENISDEDTATLLDAMEG